MVALSSLLMIVFFIIVLYMLNTNRKYPPLPVEKLEEEINRRMADDNKLFREEFNALPACPIQATCEAASKEENKEKNRYVNILPYDHSRVHLSSIEGVPDSDYINASFINKFIFCPLQCKCAQYWPDQGCWTYGNIRVSVEDMTVLVDYTIRKFCIQQVGDVTNKKPQRLVTQFHFTSWPDFGPPQSLQAFPLHPLLEQIVYADWDHPDELFIPPKSYKDLQNMLCFLLSAGVGRTGTFIVIDAMLDMMNSEKKVDVYGFVSRIRAQRCQMVQTDMQYVFIYQALLEHFLYGDTELEVTSLETHLQKLYNKISGTNSNGLEEEFKVRPKAL
ncbi:hypothetical protein AB205_0120880, partial [Aquarana catesbeiana]